MYMYTKILVPVDSSDHSKKAVQHAAFLAKIYNAEITIFHVVQPLPGYIEQIDHEELMDNLKKYAYKLVDDIAGEVKRNGVKVKTEVRVGHPADEICTESESGYDLIVIGNRGLNPAMRLLLGSVTSRVCRHAPCPVLLMR